MTNAVLLLIKDHTLFESHSGVGERAISFHVALKLDGNTPQSRRLLQLLFGNLKSEPTRV